MIENYIGGMRVRQKMGVLGPVGTHSEAAALYLMAWQRLRLVAAL